MIKRLFRKLKNIKNYQFKFINNKNLDISIFDNINNSEIEYCIPKKYTFETFNINKSIPIQLRLIYLYNFITYYLKTKKLIISAYLSYIKIKNIKLLITFIDNSYIVSQISKYNHKLKILSIQNGIRTSNKIHGWQNIEFKHLYTFGNYEIDLLSKNQCRYKKIYKVGSLRYGVYKKYFTNNFHQKNIVSFISQWRFNNKNTLSIFMKKYLENISSTILKTTKENNKKFKIIPALISNDKNYYKEEQYYKNMFFDYTNDFVLKKINKYDSYMFAENSDLIITFCSTLAIELYGQGIKCLFLNFENEQNYSELNYFSEITKHIPDKLRIDSIESEIISKKITEILNMNIYEYLALTKKSRDYFITINKNYAHEIIEKDILKLLN